MMVVPPSLKAVFLALKPTKQLAKQGNLPGKLVFSVIVLSD